jgi:hypothetical protein
MGAGKDVSAARVLPKSLGRFAISPATESPGGFPEELDAAAQITAEDLAASVESVRRYFTPLMLAMLNAKAKREKLPHRL